MEALDTVPQQLQRATRITSRHLPADLPAIPLHVRPGAEVAAGGVRGAHRAVPTAPPGAPAAPTHVRVSTALCSGADDV
jgi:hypothetical protein